ncbi:MAG TPA: HipA family kinase [Gemmatimonadaceae bacterium]|nr:HipA family kinase [Gemmatimonadaceae bacterium]
MSELRNLTATRYVQPLREGGSLPAIVDTDGDGLYVAKFRGAGQGAKALIAELIVGQLAQIVGLPTPDLALIRIPKSFGQSEPDPEIQDLLRKSHGVNFGIRYLDGAFNYDPNAADEFISSELASRIVWFDAFLTNPDRTHRNPNLLIWNRKPWLIDHGAALYAHHDWQSVDETRTRSAFPLIKDHVLLSGADQIDQADKHMLEQLSAESITKAVGGIPDELLRDETVAADFSNPAAVRRRYVDYLMLRSTEPRSFVSEAIDARSRAKKTRPRRVASRR